MDANTILLASSTSTVTTQTNRESWRPSARILLSSRGRMLSATSQSNTPAATELSYAGEGIGSSRCISLGRAAATTWAKIFALAAFGSSLAGCGSIPDAKVSYYLTKTRVTVKVTRSVLCDAKNYPLVANTVLPGTGHSADLANPQPIQLAGLRGPLTDSDVKFEFYDDGRLKAVNTSMTGQGEAVVKAVTTLASTVAAFDATKSLPAFPKECAYVKERAGDKPLTLTYEVEVDPTKRAFQPIPPDAASTAYAENLKSAIGEICVVAKDALVPVKPVEYAAKESDVLIAARQPAMVPIEVGTVTAGSCLSPLYKGTVPVAQLGTAFVLPIPRAAAFGKQTLSASFLDSGALSSVQYVNNSGTASALGAINSFASNFKGESISDQVNAVKAQADLILQQQRLLQCQADPKNCK